MESHDRDHGYARDYDYDQDQDHDAHSRIVLQGAAMFALSRPACRPRAFTYPSPYDQHADTSPAPPPDSVGCERPSGGVWNAR